MRLDKPAIIRLEGLDPKLCAGLRNLCIDQDMLRSETYVSPLLRVLLGPLYSSYRFVSRKLGMGLADVTSMHRYYGDMDFIRMATAAKKAAETRLNGELSLVTALTHKARCGESSGWHNGYFSPYIYNDNADVYSVWVPLQSTSLHTGSGFRFWYDPRIEAEAKQLCKHRWDQLDQKSRPGPAHIASPGKELRALYKLAAKTDCEQDARRCTYHARLGEAILFNEYWPHKTTKWVGKGVRLSIVLRFVKKGTGINPMRLQRRKQALRLTGTEWAQYCSYISKIEG